MAEAPGFLIGPKLLQQIQQTVRHYVNTYGGGDSGRVRQQGQQRLQAILMADLLAAVDTLTDPSTTVAEILRRNTAGDLERSGQFVTVVNRFENISIDHGVYVKIEWIDGEWQPYAADCGQQSGAVFQSQSGGGFNSESLPAAESL